MAACRDCLHWKRVANERGECSIQKIIILRKEMVRNTETGESFPGFVSMPREERENYRAFMITTADFGCTSWAATRTR